MTKRYLSKVDMTYAPKNSLEKEVIKYLKRMDRLIVHSEDISELKKIILKHIKVLEKAYPRCSKLDAIFYHNQFDECFWLDVRCASFKLYEGKDFDWDRRDWE